MSENTCPHGRFEPSACHECVNDLIGRARVQKATLAQRDEEMRVFSADLRRRAALWDAVGAPAVGLLGELNGWGAVAELVLMEQSSEVDDLAARVRALLARAEEQQS